MDRQGMRRCLQLYSVDSVHTDAGCGQFFGPNSALFLRGKTDRRLRLADRVPGAHHRRRRLGNRRQRTDRIVAQALDRNLRADASERREAGRRCGGYVLAQHRRRGRRTARPPTPFCIRSIRGARRAAEKLANRIDNLAQHSRTGCMLHPELSAGQTALAVRNAAGGIPRGAALDERRRIPVPAILRQSGGFDLDDFGQRPVESERRTTMTRKCWKRSRSRGATCRSRTLDQPCTGLQSLISASSGRN